MKESTKKVMMILFMLFMVVGLSSSFLFFGASNPAKRYGKIKFDYDGVNNIWIAKINGKEAAFSFLPQDTAPVSIRGKPIDLLKDKIEIDVTSDLNNSYNEGIALAQYQMGLVLYNYDIFIRQGFTSWNLSGIPHIECANSTTQIPVVYFIESNVSRINESENCIIAEIASNSDAVRVKDRIIYGILGVMEQK